MLGFGEHRPTYGPACSVMGTVVSLIAPVSCFVSDTQLREFFFAVIKHDPPMDEARLFYFRVLPKV